VLAFKYRAAHDLHRIFFANYCALDATEEIGKQFGDAVERVLFAGPTPELPRYHRRTAIRRYELLPKQFTATRLVRGGAQRISMCCKRLPVRIQTLGGTEDPSSRLRCYSFPFREARRTSR
jgi:hypothetical protein